MRRNRSASTREKSPVSQLTGWVRANTNGSDFVADQRAWVVLVADIAGIIIAISLLIFQRTLRGEPYSASTLAALYMVLAGASVSLLLLRLAGYRAAAHAVVALGMLSIWYLNARYAPELILKSQTVYLVVISVLPALLLGRVWMIIYGVGTLLVVAYITSVIGRSGEVTSSMVIDFLVDTTVAVVFVVFFTYIISDIYSRALERVGRLLDRQQRQNADLIRMAQLVEQNEAQKRQFYRDTIYSITDGKLAICDQSEIRPLIASAAVSLDVPDAASSSAARREVKDYLEQQGLTGERLESFVIAVGEAITNLIKHAGGGRACAGRSDGSLWVACEDHGPGIESLVLPRAVLLRGFSTKPSLGLGYSVILEIADRVLLKTDETGTTVVLFMSIHPEPQERPTGYLPDTW